MTDKIKEKCYFKITKKGLILITLYVSVLASSILVTQVTHQNRKLLNELYQEKEIHDRAQSEYGRLILEQSTYTAYSRVESLATSEIMMKVPEPSEIIMISKETNTNLIPNGKEK